MRCLNRNKQLLYYANATDRQPSVSEKKIIVDGVEVSVDEGDYIQTYEVPVEFFANITFSGNESTDVEFGVDRTAYDAILVTNLNEVPITETSLVWFSNEPPTSVNDGSTADFSVVAVKKSLNNMKAILQKRVRK